MSVTANTKRILGIVLGIVFLVTGIIIVYFSPQPWFSGYISPDTPLLPLPLGTVILLVGSGLIYLEYKVEIKSVLKIFLIVPFIVAGNLILYVIFDMSRYRYVYVNRLAVISALLCALTIVVINGFFYWRAREKGKQ